MPNGNTSRTEAEFAAIEAEEEASLQRVIARIKAGTYAVKVGYDEEPYEDPSASTDGSGQ